MSSSKHPKVDERDNPLPKDQERNPEIGQSGGTFSMTGNSPDAIEGDNTVEGDIENDTTPTGGVPEHQRMRTNK